ncbi:hypothetical protein HPB51_006858 [Rhipicephalus microplus]|uniref:Uncharacterized protein n=1 Tax=Rhipicephalus microplus TaxID=6941 RepID=A0A9J6E805_RHIMP|nr:hypothetical protein HPB51_006858 [Rhipicephalus microplus]
MPGQHPLHRPSPALPAPVPKVPKVFPRKEGPSEPSLVALEGGGVAGQAKRRRRCSSPTTAHQRHRLHQPLPAGLARTCRHSGDTEVLPTPLPSGVEDSAGDPADHQAAQASSPSDEYSSPAEEELPEQTAWRAIGSPPPPSPEVMTPRRVDQRNGSTYGTQEKAANTAGPESA